MKIIYFHQYFNTPEMSGSTRSFEFAKRLIQMGHEVEVVTTDRSLKNKKKWYQTSVSGIKLHWLPLNYSNHMNFLQRLKAFFEFAWKAYFKAIKIKGDIVFASSTPLTIALPAILISKKKKIPMVFEVRDLWPDVPIAMKILKNPFIIFLAKKLESWTYKNSKAIIALSPEMKKGIVSKNINPNKIAVIPNSSDIEKFKFKKRLALSFRNKRPWLKNRPLFLYAGTFGKVNNLSYVIKLSKALIKQNPEIRILLIGDGKEKNELILDAKKKGVYRKNLFFEKPLQKKDMPACLSAANISANLIIDIKENWANSANKFFDTLAAGKPVFLNHGGWMQDLVLNYNCGLCMHGKKIEVVAKELDFAITNKKWLKKAGSSSLKLAKKFFDRNEHVKQLEKILVLSKQNNVHSISKITKDFYH
jgi:glycosyltransferase involved in cell wall biosynthesis